MGRDLSGNQKTAPIRSACQVNPVLTPEPTSEIGHVSDIPSDLVHYTAEHEGSSLFVWRHSSGGSSTGRTSALWRRRFRSAARVGTAVTGETFGEEAESTKSGRILCAHFG